MKQIEIKIILAIFALTFILCYIGAEIDLSQAKKGDLNLDGRVDQKDLSILSYYWTK